MASVASSMKKMNFSGLTKQRAMYAIGFCLILIILAHLHATSATIVRVDSQKNPIHTSTNIIYGQVKEPVVRYVGGAQNAYKKQFYN